MTMTRGRADSDVVDALVRREAAALLRYFERRVLPIEDAADLVSETLLVIWRRIDALPPDEEQARMWMYGIARRVLATHRRTSIRRAGLADRLRDELATTGHSVERDPRIDALEAALALLDTRDQEIIRLVHWDDFTLRAAAQLLRMREGTVRSRYSRARARLAASLSGL